MFTFISDRSKVPIVTSNGEIWESFISALLPLLCNLVDVVLLFKRCSFAHPFSVPFMVATTAVLFRSATLLTNPVDIDPEKNGKR